MMKVLITGADGFIGSRLCTKLRGSGHEVVGLGLLDKDTVDLKGDILDRDWIKDSIKECSPDLVFHLAAISSVGFSFREPSKTYDVNVTGTLNLLDSLEEGTRFVFSGSAEEYGEPVRSREHFEELKRYYGIIPDPFRIPELPSREEDPLRPLSPYAVSKVMGELLVRNYPGIDDICVRSYNVEGLGRGEEFVTSKIASGVKEMVEGNRKKIEVGNIFNFRDWSHVDDVLEYYKVLGEKGVSGEVYNIGSGQSRSILSFILECFNELNMEIEKIGSDDLVVEDPIDLSNEDLFNREYEHLAIDDLLVEEDLKHLKGSVLELRSGSVSYHLSLDERFFRGRDIRFQAGDMSRIKELGCSPEKKFKDIVSDLLN